MINTTTDITSARTKIPDQELKTDSTDSVAMKETATAAKIDFVFPEWSEEDEKPILGRAHRSLLDKEKGNVGEVE
ncbi:hypothetical protein BKA70DRAFT_1448358 [Coprinopsis sp. MPI-PUGE-AT-0042]|nr:hypothetical protein BKA70DRAFT_1448358 [Coprinopsis sp. MPI-PUGE-AT-0042]